MKKQFKVLLLIAMICVLALATMLVSSALDASQGDNAYQVGSKGYAATLADAIAGASAGDTITLLKDVSDEANVAIDKNLTIDGNGYTLAFADMTPGEGEDAVLMMINAANVLIKNVKFSGASTDALLRNNYVDGVVELNNVYLRNIAHAVWYGSAGNHIKFTGANTDILTPNSQVIYAANDIITDSHIEVTVDVEGGTISSGTNDSFRLTGNGVVMTVKGGTLEGADIIYVPSGYVDGTVTIFGNTTFNSTSEPINIGVTTLDVYGNVTINATSSSAIVTTEGAEIYVAGNVTINAKTYGIVVNDSTGAYADQGGTVVVLGTETGYDKSGVADNISITCSAAGTTKASTAVRVANQGSTVTIWSGSYVSGAMALWIAQTSSAEVEEKVHVTIHGGKFITDGTQASGGYDSGIYFRGTTLTINGGFFSYIDLDPNEISFKTTYTNADSIKTCKPLNIAESAGSYSPVVNINGGTFFCGNGNGTVYIAEENVTVNATGGTHYGYAWLRPNAKSGYTFNVYGGNYYSNPNQPNCQGMRLDGTGTANIYGGHFEIMQNAAATTGALYVNSATVVANVYGGEFISHSNEATHGPVYVGKADATVNFKAAGTAYTAANGSQATSTGATLNRFNASCFINFAAAGTVTIEGGNVLKLSNSTATDTSAFFAGTTTNLSYTNSEDATGSVIFALSNTPWIFADSAEWGLYDYEIHAWSAELAPFDNTYGDAYSFSGYLEDDMDAYTELLTEFVHYQFLDNGDTVYKNFFTSADRAEAKGGRHNVTINLIDLSQVTIADESIELYITGISGTVGRYAPLFTVKAGYVELIEADLELDNFAAKNGIPGIEVAGGALVLTDCEFTSHYGSTGFNVWVTADNSALTVTGGTYQVWGGYAFYIGTADDYSQSKNSIENTVPGVTAEFDGVTMYNLSGGVLIYATGGDTITVSDCFMTTVAEYTSDTVLDLYPEKSADAHVTGYSLNGIWTAAANTVVNNLTAFPSSGGGVLMNMGTGVLDVVGGEYHAYRLLFANSGITNLYDVTWTSNPGQGNNDSICTNGVAEAVINIYGGTYTWLKSNIQTSGEQGIIRLQNAATANIYGGTFIGEQNGTGVQMFYQTVAGSTLKFWPAGTSYTNYDGSAATSVAATVKRDGDGSVFDLNSKAVTLIVDGVSFELTGGAYMIENHAAAVEAAAADEATNEVTFTNSTVNVKEGGLLPADEAIWDNTQFIVYGTASMAVLINGDNYTITDKASAISVANAALLRAYNANTYIKPNKNLSLDLTDVVPFEVQEGATLVLNWAGLAYTGTFVNVNGGTVTVKAGTFTTDNADSIFVLNAGTLTIGGGTFTKTDKGAWDEGIIDVINGALNISGGSFTMQDGGAMFAVDGGATTITVSGGSFKNWAPAEGASSNYCTGGIFYLGGGAINTTTGTLTISGGEFWATGIVRIYAVNTTDDTYTADSVAHETNGYQAYISGGIFHGVADENVNTNEKYMFQIARPGNNLIEFTEGSTAVVDASAYNWFFMSNASAVLDSGATFHVYGGTFDGGQVWIGGNKICTFVIDGATFTDTKGVTTGSSWAAIYSTTTSSFTIKNATLSAPNVTNGLFYFDTTASYTVENSFLKARLLIAADAAATADIKDSTIVLLGNEGVIFENAATTLERVTVVTSKAYSSAKPTANHTTIDAYAPVVMYSGEEWYAWTSNSATDATNKPVTETGAALYTNTADAETSGIRFTSSISADVLTALTANGETVKFGTLVAPADYVAKAKAFTTDALDAAGIVGTAYVKIPAEHSIVYDGEGNVSFSGILVNLKSNTRAYAAVAYIEVYEGEGDGATLKATYYGAYDSQNNARSAEQMADAMIAAGEAYNALGTEEKAIVDAYANGKVALPEAAE